MNTIIFATNNQDKVREARSILSERFHILSLKEAGIDIDIPEPYDTLEANALEKARIIYRLTNQNCFSEDTGLEVEMLNGEPGVRSARYAGNKRSFEDNIDKLLLNLKNQKNRNAQFRTVMCVVINGQEKSFEGVCKGTIIAKRRGAAGFGYDSIFIPEGSSETFAEMTMKEKNYFSHRRKALEKIISFLS
jgi:XTP/dITP diphosphohydrolase